MAEELQTQQIGARGSTGCATANAAAQHATGESEVATVLTLISVKRNAGLTLAVGSPRQESDGTARFAISG